MVVVRKKTKQIRHFCEDCDHGCNPNKENHDHDHSPKKDLEVWHFCDECDHGRICVFHW